MRWTLAMLTLTGCEGDGFTLIGTNPTTPNSPDSGAPVVPSCDRISSQGLCTELVGNGYTEQEVQGSCIGGVVGDGCPTGDVLGSCGLQVGSAFEAWTYHYAGDYYTADNIDAAESTCVLTGGVWR